MMMDKRDEERYSLAKCEKCGEMLRVPDSLEFDIVECPHCGVDLTKTQIIRNMQPATAPTTKGADPVRRAPRQAPKIQEVFIAGIEIPFPDLFLLLVKLAIAAIPAGLIIGLFYVMLFTVFGGCISSFIF